MLHATELLGGEAYDAQGHFVGRVTELFIEPADQPGRVAAGGSAAPGGTKGSANAVEDMVTPKKRQGTMTKPAPRQRVKCLPPASASGEVGGKSRAHGRPTDE